MTNANIVEALWLIYTKSAKEQKMLVQFIESYFNRING